LLRPFFEIFFNGVLALESFNDNLLVKVGRCLDS
jgi:hypothetical protein